LYEVVPVNALIASDESELEELGIAAVSAADGIPVLETT
jgi:hypothetical protein